MGDLDEGSHEGLESREVQVITPRIGIDTYSKFLRTPGFLSIQLRAEGATTEDLLQFPARISKEGKVSATYADCHKTLHMSASLQGSPLQAPF